MLLCTPKHVCPAWDYTMPRSNSEKWICSKFFMSLRRVYEASYFGLYLDIQLSTGCFLRNTFFVLTRASILLSSPLPSCSTICYLMTAAGLLSAMFNFSPSVSTTSIPSTLFSGQLKNHNHQHTGPVQIAFISIDAAIENLKQALSFDYAIWVLYEVANEDSIPLLIRLQFRTNAGNEITLKTIFLWIKI